ncbi:MAG: hypothetical protein ACOCXJ_03670 [Planctomycetota bacterium]
MTDALRGTWAMIWVSLLELRRQQLWLLAAVPAILLAVLVPQMRAVDAADQVKLGTTAILASMGFLATLLAILLGAGLLRRDREQQVELMLFAKPLGRGSYLAGRWLGILTGLLLGLVLIAAAGALGLAIGLGRVPDVRALTEPAAQWTTVDHVGQEHALHGSRVVLSGAPGDAVRFVFNDLDTSRAARLLLRAQVRHHEPGWPLRRARVAVGLYPLGGDPADMRYPAISPDSPYGTAGAADDALAAGEALLTDRGRSRDDLEMDYLSLDLPPDLLAEDLVVQVTRIEDQATITFHHDPDRGSSAYISRPAGGFLTNLLRATLVLLAQAGILVALAALVACISNLGVCLLAGLTLYFAGHSLDIIDQVLRRGEYGTVFGRLLELLRLLVPDLTAYGLPARLAGGRAVDWALVLDAWIYYGMYSLILLSIAWWTLQRRRS